MTVDIDLEAFALDLAVPFESATAQLTERRGIAIRVRTAEGYGVGEATPLSGWTEEYDACAETLSNIAKQPLEHPGHVQLPADRPAARHGLQLAVTDYAARRAGLSLASYLGGDDMATAVPLNATIGNVEIDASVEAAEAAVDAGFSALKCKVGDRTVEAERDRLTAIREAIGPTIALRVDANRAWDLEQARQLWPTLANLDVEYVEEPLEDVSPERLDALDRQQVGIAIDESVHAADGRVGEWLPVVDAIILKPMALGGIDRALDLGMRASTNDVRPVVSGTVDAVVARTAAVHLAAVLPETAPAGLATASRLATDLAPDPLTVRDGEVDIPDVAGLGTAGPWAGGTA